MNTAPCTPCCSTPQVVNVPGVPGGNGVTPTNGINALSITSANFTVPAVGATVTVNVDSSLWYVVGQIVIATGPANFSVSAIPTSTSVTLTFLGYPGDIAPASVIASGATIAPAGQRGGSTVYYTSTAASIGLTAFMDVIEVTADNKTMTLPSAVGIAGKIYTIKQSAVYASGTLVATSGGQTIDGAANKTIAVTNGFIVVVSNGANWVMLANKLT